ncbi:MAG: dihydrofolate reductase [Firmicutes bacterium]|nr:dihydrofolate reductase [Bacillota bacterium]
MDKKQIDNISIIASVGKNREIGKDNKLIWRFKEDMNFFKEQTMNKPIVMGYNTFKSLPKILPGRRHIVLTSRNIENSNIEIYNNLDNLINFIKDYKEEVMIIGGATLYNKFIEYASKLYMTEIEAICKDADTFFPKIDDSWKKQELSSQEENNIKYKHLLYTKK